MENRSITITARTEISVLPDFTKVALHLNEKEKEYKTAFDKLQRKTAEIFECARRCGIAANEIKANDFHTDVNKKVEYDRRGKAKTTIESYSCHQSISIGFFTDPQKLGMLLDQISFCIEDPDIDVAYSLKDRSKFDKEILEKLTREAMNKAQIFCMSSNAKIGKLLCVEHHQSGMLRFLQPSIPRAYAPSMPGQTGQLSAPGALRPVAAQPTAGSTQIPPSPSAITNLMPVESRVEETATFVWEIIDN